MVNALSRRPDVKAPAAVASRERMHCYFRQHWIRLLKPLCTLLAASAALVVMGYYTFGVLDITTASTRHLALALFSVVFVIIHLQFLARFYRYFLNVIVITDRKVHRIKKTLIAIDDHQSIDITSLQDVRKLQRGIVQNFLGFGTLVLEAQDTEFRVHFVPNIREKHALLMRLEAMARRTAQPRKTLPSS